MHGPYFDLDSNCKNNKEMKQNYETTAEDVKELLNTCNNCIFKKKSLSLRAITEIVYLGFTAKESCSRGRGSEGRYK